jgi:ABC-type Fe3+-hydroxamate transport system substrate-binding protein
LSMAVAVSGTLDVTVTHYLNSSVCPYVATTRIVDEYYGACGDTADLAIEGMRKKIAKNEPVRDQPSTRKEIKIKR